MNENCILPQLHVQPIRQADLQEVLAIEITSFDNPWKGVFFEEDMEKDYAHLYLARLPRGDCSGEIVGYICFWLVADEIQIAKLAVRLGYRRRGIGKLLVLYGLQLGYQAGARLAVLEARWSNQAARALYQELGFEIVQERPHYYRESGEAAVVLELSLDRPWWRKWKAACESYRALQTSTGFVLNPLVTKTVES